MLSSGQAATSLSVEISLEFRHLPGLEQAEVGILVVGVREGDEARDPDYHGYTPLHGISLARPVHDRRLV